MIGWLYSAADRLRRWKLADDHGRIGEDLAHRYLRKRGCTIVARRYRPLAGGGEIDIVAWHGGKLVFVEVKTRASGDFGAPERAVDEWKQSVLARAGREYARRAGVEWRNVRFDIVSILLSRPPQIEWLPDAFHAAAESAPRARPAQFAHL
ncbi:MAG TPA: YraN family protein [Bryobacteraceae bacterium]|nr:YraN family protein [Bryobacteraceae bacterium]